MSRPRLTRRDLEERQKKFEEGKAVFKQAVGACERGKDMYFRTRDADSFTESNTLCARAVELLRAAKHRDPLYVSN
jgi:hypothetical protein